VINDAAHASGLDDIVHPFLVKRGFQIAAKLRAFQGHCEKVLLEKVIFYGFAEFLKKPLIVNQTYDDRPQSIFNVNVPERSGRICHAPPWGIEFE
jgi:hypothetical protein